MTDELSRMNITAWSPQARSIIRAALLKAAAMASHAESVEAVRIVRLIDEVGEREHTGRLHTHATDADADCCEICFPPAGSGTSGGSL